MKITAAERRALDALDRFIPRHPIDLQRRDKVRYATLQRLCTARPDRPALVALLELKQATIYKSPYYPFYYLTEAGLAARDGGKR